MNALGSADFSVILVLYRGCPLLKVKLHRNDPVGATALVLHREVKCNVSFIWRLRGFTIYTVKQECNAHYNDC